MNKILIAFLLLLNLPSYSQNFLQLYHKHIPNNIEADRILSNSLELNLQRNAMLHPDLIYLTLNYYKQYDGSKFDTKLFEILKSNERIWLSRRNKWADKTINKIRSVNNHDVLSKTESELDKLIIPLNLKADDRIIELKDEEKKLQDFFVVMLYKNDPEMKFDENIDYTLTRDQMEKNKLNYFSEVSRNSEIISSPSQIVNDLISNWFLFYEKSDIEAADVLMNSLQNVMYDKSRKNFSVWLSGVLFNSIECEQPISLPDITNSITISKSSSLPQISFGIGYKLFINKNSFLISYVDFQAYYSKGFNENRYKQTILSATSLQEGNYKIDQVVRNFDNDFKLYSLNSYGVKLSLPIFQLSPFNFEIGCGFNFNSYYYQPDMLFTYSKYRTEFDSNGNPIFRETLALGSKTFNDEVKKEYFSISPTFDISYNTTSDLGLKLSGGYNIISISIFYLFPLYL